MILQVSVTQGEGCALQGFLPARGVGNMCGRGHARQGDMHDRGCVAWGVCGRGVHAGETSTEAGGMHPTGMHSCRTRKRSFMLTPQCVMCKRV